MKKKLVEKIKRVKLCSESSPNAHLEQSDTGIHCARTSRRLKIKGGTRYNLSKCFINFLTEKKRNLETRVSMGPPLPLLALPVYIYKREYQMRKTSYLIKRENMIHAFL